MRIDVLLTPACKPMAFHPKTKGKHAFCLRSIYVEVSNFVSGVFLGLRQTTHSSVDARAESLPGQREAFGRNGRAAESLH